ncbi:hypothetical protein FGB62_54g114 [Gracilaria domingensis]|nr:hypothetical protein FGB62_54g114 [Gracilaria domingensis]
MNVNGNCIVSGIGQGPQEMERMRAMLDFEKNVKPGEYIDYDLYGRGDSRVFSEMTSSGEKSPKSQMQLVKGTENHRTGNTWFLPPNSLGSMVRSVLGKLSKTMDCFGPNTSSIDLTANSAPFLVEVTPPDAVASISSSPRDRPDPAHGKRFTDGDKLLEIKEPRKAIEEHHVEQVEAIDAHAEEDSHRIVDETPRRVKSKVDSGDDLSVVEKGTVVRTLTNLRSTGSFVFKDTRSLVSQDDNRSDGDFNAVKTSCLLSNDSADVVQGSGAQPSREDVRSQDASLIPRELFHSGSDNDASAGEHIVVVEKTTLVENTHQAAEDGVLVGNVTRLRSVFEEDSSGVADAVLVHQLEATKERKPLEHSAKRDELRRRSTKGCENVEKDTELQNGSFDDATDLPHASETSGTIKTVKSALDIDESHVADEVVIRRVSSALKVSALALGPETLNKEMKGIPEVQKSISTTDLKEVEQPPLVSIHDLSRHLSGRVQTMKSMFESRSGETDSDGFELESQFEGVYHIRSGLSCDSGVLSNEDEKDGDSVKVEGQATVESAMGKDGGSESIRVTDVTRTHEGVEKQGRDMEIFQVVENCVVTGGDSTSNSADEVMSELVEEEGLRTEHEIESHRSSRESPRDVIDESSTDSVASFDDISQPFSHIVGSCLLM